MSIVLSTPGGARASLWSRAIATVGLIGLFAATVSAHDARVIGTFRIELGWGDEPAFTGIRNSVMLEVTDARTKAPIDDFGGGSLSAEVIFGAERTLLKLQPSWEHHNVVQGWIIPTRAGVYTFRVTGRIKGQAVDFTSTCSDKTFDCVVSAAEIQFPAKDPSASEVAARVERSLPRADRALDSARRTATVAYAALAASAIAFVVAVTSTMRRRAER